MNNVNLALGHLNNVTEMKNR